LVLRGKRDPVKVNREAGGKNRQVKIDPGERARPDDCKRSSLSTRGHTPVKEKELPALLVTFAFNF
jgi:hypothetical protein